MLRKIYHLIKCRPQNVFRLKMTSKWPGLPSVTPTMTHTERFSHPDKKELLMVRIKFTQ